MFGYIYFIKIPCLTILILTYLTSSFTKLGYDIPPNRSSRVFDFKIQTFSLLLCLIMGIYNMPQIQFPTYLQFAICIILGLSLELGFSMIYNLKRHGVIFRIITEIFLIFLILI